MSFVAFIRAIVKRAEDWLKKLLKPKRDPSGLEYTHWTGTYKRPDYDGGHKPGVLPKQLGCGDSFVIYIATPTWENTCAGFGGPNDGNNPNCVTALQTANAAAAQVTCPSECPKQVTEIWRGWKCEKEPGDKRSWAICAVELEVTCPITD